MGAGAAKKELTSADGDDGEPIDELNYGFERQKCARDHTHNKNVREITRTKDDGR